MEAILINNMRLDLPSREKFMNGIFFKKTGGYTDLDPRRDTP